MELTDKMVGDAVKQGWMDFVMPYSQQINLLAKALQAERAKPKVWDKAPEDATKARVEYFSPKYANFSKGMEYTRTLPKTRAREIAEVQANKWSCAEFPDGTALSDIIEAAILKREAELLG